MPCWVDGAVHDRSSGARPQHPIQQYGARLGGRLWSARLPSWLGPLATGQEAGAAASLLFELKGCDPTVFPSAALVLVLVALGAGFVPALRASRIDPMTALRYE
jgi:hypothetical protein